MLEKHTRGPWLSAVGFVLTLGSALGCGTTEPDPAAARTLGYEPYYVDEATELAVGKIPGLASWHRDVLLACPPAPVEGNAHGGAARFAGCEVSRVVDGAIVPLQIKGARAARRLRGDSLLVQKVNLDLVVRAASGEENVVASSALTPTVAPDGERIAFIQLPAGTTEPLPGIGRTTLVLLDLLTGERRTVSTDSSAYAPYIVPGTSDVIFVSARTGLASLWIAPASGPERQLTNMGLTRVGKGFVPVPLDQLVWLPGTHKAVFTAHYGVDMLWVVDADTGAAEALGPGSFPNLTAGDKLLGFDPGPMGDAPRAPAVNRYLEAP